MKTSGILLVIFSLFIAFTGCKKVDFPENTPSVKDQGIAFSIKPGDNPSGLKATLDCFSEPADYAIAQIDDSAYTVAIFYIGEIPYTNSIQLLAGPHVLQEFTMWSDNNTPNTKSDDWVMAATPHVGSNYASYVETSLDITFNIEPFVKIEFPIEAVCFEEDHYIDFGFTYFQINQVTIREEAFFGDICMKNPDDYLGSLYAQQSGGLQVDMSAICKIEVYRNGVLQGTFDNEAWFGQGQPLMVTYGDRANETDQFEFKLYILVRKGAAFEYVYFHSWLIDDAQVIPQGNDGVVDFVLGDCAPDADVVIPPYINLPSTCSYQISGPTAPGSLGGYVNANLTNIPTGYEIQNSTVPSWCADHQTSISTAVYNMDVYSSLNQSALPAFVQGPKWNSYNWLMNHLDWYPGYLWSDLQGALWLFDSTPWNGHATGGVPALTPRMTQMHNDALLYGANYKVPTGGWACVIFIPAGTSPSAPTPAIQTMFIKVDP